MRQLICVILFGTLSLTIISSETAAQADDYGNEPTAFEATLLPPENVQVQGRIETIGDVDCFMLETEAQAAYTFATSDLGDSLDTLLILFDRNSRTVLAVDDNGGEGRASKLVWSAAFSDLYFVCIRNARATQGSGTYTLTVTSSLSGEAPTATTPLPPTTNDQNDDAQSENTNQTNHDDNNDTSAPSQETTQPSTPEQTPPPVTTTPPVSEPRAPTNSTTILREGRIALLGADDPASISNVQGYLRETGVFPAIEIINTSQVTPSAAELNQFEAVLVWADSGFGDADALGDRLADYVDRGGGVVVAAVSFDAPDPFDPDTLGGRFLAGGYYVIKPDVDNVGDDRRVLGAVQNPGHPVMQGVSKIDGGPSSLHSPTTSLTSGGSTIASWDNGDVLVAVKSMGQARRVDVNLFPPSSLLDPDLWPFTQDNDVPRLMANALLWVSGREQPFNETPQGQLGMLAVSPLTLNFSAREGDRSPNNKSLTLRNEGGQSLNWVATSDADWVTINQTQGELQPDESQPLIVSVDTASLIVGTHTASITISAPNAGSEVTRISITLILDPLVGSVEPTSNAGTGRVLQVPSQFSDLSEAVAQAQDGDTIEISAGTFNNVALTLNASITLRGNPGLNRSVLRGDGLNPVITLGQSSAGITLENLTITGGSDGILITNLARVMVENSIVQNNLGWGIRLRGVARFVSVDNSVDANGSGGITIDIGDASNKSSQVQINQNALTNNQGCGIHVASDEPGIQITGSDNRIEGNDFDVCDNANRLPSGFKAIEEPTSDAAPSPLEFDGDGDGVPDADDFCPVTPGRKDNNGCP